MANGHGGARPGAGRPSGSPRPTAALARQAIGDDLAGGLLREIVTDWRILRARLAQADADSRRVERAIALLCGYATALRLEPQREPTGNRIVALARKAAPGADTPKAA